jgi:hypothetical protein
MHVDAVYGAAYRDVHDAFLVLGCWSSLVIDGLVKLAGLTKMNFEFNRYLPLPASDTLCAQVIDRAKRLYLVTPLLRDRTGSSSTEPVLDDLGRRQLMVELDALVALGLGLDVDELITLYRSQFPVLRKYEHAMRFDANGRQVPNDVLKSFAKDSTSADLQGYELVEGRFRQVHREAEMRANYERFADEFGRPNV